MAAPHGTPALPDCTATSCARRHVPGPIADDADRPWCPRHYALIFTALDNLNAFLGAAICALTRAGRPLPLAA